MTALRHDVDWRPALRHVAWIPGTHHRGTMPRSVATRVLRCTEASFDQLLDLGLPATETETGPAYDPFDVKNVALHSGTGTTEVEIAMRAIFGYMRSPVADLVAETAWTYALSVEPAATTDTAGPVRVHRPTPEDFGGSLDSCETADGPVADDGRCLRVAPGAIATGVLRTRGQAAPLRSASIRSITEDLLGSGVAWHFVPGDLDSSVDVAADAGLSGCVTLSVRLERLLAAAGHDARSYRGWSVGSLTPHAWVEVVDDDGAPKFVDPALALLALRYDLGPREFADFVVGSATNRVVPTHCRATSSLVADVPDGALAEPYDVRLTCRSHTSTKEAP